MIRKIVLSNFMAHERTEISLADGLTVLVGPNNIGKSTIALALKILARNTNSNFVMQHGQKECSISVQTSEGHSIEWIKRKSPSYVINGQTKDRLGRGGTPPELDETLRLASVEFEDRDFEPHFGEQKSPIFLINRSPSQIAQFFSTTSDAERLVAIQRLHQRQKSDAQTQSKLITEDNLSVQNKLTALEPLPELERQFVGLERESAELSELSQEISRLELLVAQFAFLLVDQQYENLRSTCLKALEPIPVLNPTDHLTNIIEQWKWAFQQHARFSETSDVLVALEPAPATVPTKELEALLCDLQDSSTRMGYVDSQVQSLSSLVSPPSQEPVTLLRNAIDQLGEFEIECNRLSAIQQTVESLPAPPAIDAPDALERMVLSLESLQLDLGQHTSVLSWLESLIPSGPEQATEPLENSIKEMQKQIQEVEVTLANLEAIQSDVDRLERDTSAWLATEPLCNTCGAKLTPDSIRNRQHGHA